MNSELNTISEHQYLHSLYLQIMQHLKCLALSLNQVRGVCARSVFVNDFCTFRVCSACFILYLYADKRV